MIYQITLSQLCLAENPLNRLKVMIGARDFIHSNGGRTIEFKFSAKANEGINFCRITLNHSDLYDMEFIKIHRQPSLKRSIAGAKQKDPTTIEEYQDVYADRLKDLFEETTGLYLSL